MSVKRAWLDGVLGALGAVFGLGSLAYPFGRDQGLYYYVAREWVLRGAVPYRDVLDHKTPGVYVLYGIAVRLFGESMWGIRVLDLVCVVGTGIAAAELSAETGERVRPGARGAAILTLSVLYYGYLDFWSTAQSELWFGAFGVASLSVARRGKRDVRSAIVAGILAGAALTMKPPAVFLVLVAAFAIVKREKLLRARARLLALFGIGALVIPTMVYGYFGAKGAMPAMIDIVVHANAYYVAHEKGTSGELFVYPWYYFPLVPALLIYQVGALAHARRAHDGARFERHFFALLAIVAAFGAVAMQGKYYLLHWTVALPAYAIVAASAYRALAERFESSSSRPVLPLLAFAALLSILYLSAPAKLPVMYARAPAMWWSSSLHAFRRATGLESREAFTSYFETPSGHFWFSHSERVGIWLREHSSPEDFVTVRGFQPEIYAVAQRRHNGRFFWTTFITNPDRAYRREEWLREDRDDIERSKPKYIVTLTFVPMGPDSSAYFEPLGYHPVAVFNEYTILER